MLSSSLFLPYLLIALVVTAVAARRARTPARRRWFTVGLLVFFWAFAHIDDLLGGIQHKWLCHKEAGFFVYKTAKLPPEMFDAAGKPRFMTDRGPDKKMLGPYVRYEWAATDGYSQRFLKIDKVSFRVTDSRTEQLLGEHITFSAWPSSFIPTFRHVGSAGCVEGEEEVSLWNAWDKAILGVTQ